MLKGKTISLILLSLFCILYFIYIFGTSYSEKRLISNNTNKNIETVAEGQNTSLIKHATTDRQLFLLYHGEQGYILLVYDNVFWKFGRLQYSGGAFENTATGNERILEYKVSENGMITYVLFGENPQDKKIQIVVSDLNDEVIRKDPIHVTADDEHFLYIYEIADDGIFVDYEFVS